jgi:hypothetical protein
MSITFTPATGPGTTVTPLPGTLETGGGFDDRGGEAVAKIRAGIAQNGSCQVELSDSGLSLSAALALRSELGPGGVTVSGDAESHSALIDVEISGDAVQTAKISWKGTSAAS